MPTVAVILAAGSASRMEAGGAPKQFRRLAGRTVLAHSLAACAAAGCCDAALVVVPAEWVDRMPALCPDFPATLYCAGGKHRQESLYNALLFLRAHPPGAGDDTWIVSHDAARPLISARIIQDNLAAAREAGAAVAARPLADTLFESPDGLAIAAVPDRRRFHLAQTPQTFRLGAYIAAYESLSPRARALATDAAGVLLAAGHQVALSPGAPENLKISHEIDFDLAGLLLARGK